MDPNVDPSGGSGDPPANNDTLPVGAVSAADAENLKTTHAAELRGLREEITILKSSTEDGATVLAAKEAAEARVKVLEAVETQLTEAQASLEAANTSKDEHAATIERLTEEGLVTRRQHLVTTYKLEEDKVKDLTGPQLDAVESTLSALPANTIKPGNLGIGDNGGSGNDSPNGKPREMIRSGLESTS